MAAIQEYKHAITIDRISYLDRLLGIVQGLFGTQEVARESQDQQPPDDA